jgi:hypothetical protein
LGARIGAEAQKLLSGSVFQDWTSSNPEKQAYMPLLLGRPNFTKSDFGKLGAQIPIK